MPLPGHTIEKSILKLDISKAHRRIKILRKDWKYIAAEVDGEIYLNLVGTFGVASAQWYWGRMAALILRILYNFLSMLKQKKH